MINLYCLLFLTLEVVVQDSLQANESLPTTAAVGGVEQVSEESAHPRRGADETFVVVVKSSVADDALPSPITDEIHSFSDEPFVAILSVGALSQHLLKVKGGDGAINHVPVVAVITADI